MEREVRARRDQQEVRREEEQNEIVESPAHGQVSTQLLLKFYLTTPFLTEQKVFLGHSYGDAHFEN